MDIFGKDLSSYGIQVRHLETAKLSVVVPTYNEEAVISMSFERLRMTLETLSLEYEIIFVNDGSRDGTLMKLLAMTKQYSYVKVIDFSRNFGHQVAVSAGVEAASGNMVVLIDADLQDPPELIRTFLEKWQEGYDVVYGVRQRRAGESFFKKLTAGVFYRFLRYLSEVEVPVDTGDFRLMDRSVINALLSMPEKHRYIRGLVSWVGFNQIGIPYEREERYAGTSKYPLKKMIQLSIDGITALSLKPLRMATSLGFLCSTLGLLSILATIYAKLFTHTTIQGWASIMVIILFLGGIQLLVLGVLGEYVGRIFNEVRNRPLYVVRNRFNFTDLMSSSYVTNDADAFQHTKS